MAGPDSIPSIQQLFERPRVQQAQVLELCICDVIHFRLAKPVSVFELAEERLLKRNAALFKGFASLRNEVERTQRASPIREKIDSCCVRRSDWVAHRQVIFSTELEIWMDIAYPNPWALDLYHEALKQGKEIYIPKQGPFTELFYKMLLQKCGFERLTDSSESKNCLRIHIGEQLSLPKDCLHLDPEGSYSSESHLFSFDDSLAGQLVTGVLRRNREVQSARAGSSNLDPHHTLGYQLVGPTLLLLIQSLQPCTVPIAFTGKGSGFLTTVCEQLRHPWPWLPEITNPANASLRFSLFPEKSADTSLYPALTNDHPSVIQIDQLAPAHLLHPPMELFLEAALSGSRASIIQSAAASFLKDFAQVSRGLFLPVPALPLLENWKSSLLSPSGDFMRAFCQPSVLPGFRSPKVFSSSVGAMKSGRWPTGTYLGSSGLGRLFLRICAPERVTGIRQELNQNSESGTEA